MKKVCFLSDWVENPEEEIIACDILDNETEEQAIERAKKMYAPDLDFYIKKVN